MLGHSPVSLSVRNMGDKKLHVQKKSLHVHFIFSVNGLSYRFVININLSLNIQTINKYNTTTDEFI